MALLAIELARSKYLRIRYLRWTPDHAGANQKIANEVLFADIVAI